MRRAREEEYFWHSGVLDRNLAMHVLALHKAAVDTIDGIVRHNRRGAPPTVRNATTLGRALVDFQLRCDEHLIPESPQHLDLSLCLVELCEDVAHYLRQISITFGIVGVYGSTPRHPHRPKNATAQAVVHALVARHQAAQEANSYPPPRKIRKALEDAGHHISERTQRLWVQRLKESQQSKPDT